MLFAARARLIGTGRSGRDHDDDDDGCIVLNALELNALELRLKVIDAESFVAHDVERP